MFELLCIGIIIRPSSLNATELDAVRFSVSIAAIWNDTLVVSLPPANWALAGIDRGTEDHTALWKSRTTGKWQLYGAVVSHVFANFMEQ